MVTPVNNLPARIEGVSSEVANQAVSANTAERSTVVKSLLEDSAKNTKALEEIKLAYLQKPQNPYERGSAEVRGQLQTKLMDFRNYIDGCQGLNWGGKKPYEKESDRIADAFVARFQKAMPTASDAEMRHAMAKIDELTATLHNSPGRGRDNAEAWTAGDDGVGMGMYDAQIRAGLSAALQPLEQGKLSSDWEATQGKSQDTKLSKLLDMVTQSIASTQANLVQLAQPVSMSTGGRRDPVDDETQRAVQRIPARVPNAGSLSPLQISVNVNTAAPAQVRVNLMLV